MRTRVLLAIGLSMVWACRATAQEKPAFALPADPSSIVITLEYSGDVGGVIGSLGPGCTAEDNTNPPLVIRAGGKMTVTDKYSFCVALIAETILSPVQLQDLLRFVIVEQEFLSDTDLAEQARQGIADVKRKTGRGMIVGDVPTTAIRITTADKDKETRYVGASYFARAYPSVKPLQQISAVETRLSELMKSLKVGLKDSATSALERANLYLKQEHPDLPALNPTDYRRTAISDSGTTIEFAHDRGDAGSLSVVVDAEAQAPTPVRVRIIPPAADR